MALIHKGTQQKGQVGQSIGERRRIQKDLQAQTAPQKAAVKKPLDKFAGVAPGKNKTGLAGFAPNATFKQARRFNANGTPYKRALHHLVETGAAPVAVSDVKPPSDGAILRFLDKVIKAAPKASTVARTGAVKKMARPAGQPAKRSHRQVVANPKFRTNKA